MKADNTRRIRMALRSAETPSSAGDKTAGGPGKSAANAPTMIIPRDTEIRVDEHGRLSICTPGNLVLQNSGSFAVLESQGGSVRIEPEVVVDAMEVRCADTCFVQGRLRTWKLKARQLHLEDGGLAEIVLQETEELKLSKNARLVGNFRSEEELYLLFSRFAPQLKELPFGLQAGTVPAELAVGGDPGPEEAPESDLALGVLSSEGELSDLLKEALSLLDEELVMERVPSGSSRILQEIVNLLRASDLEALRHTYQTLFGRIDSPTEDIVRSEEIIREHFLTEGS